MKYMLLIVEDPEERAKVNPDGAAMMAEYGAFTNRIIESGEFLAGDPLHGNDTASTVRTRGGSTTITDGPFAETKEQIGGYYIVDVASLDRALELAAQIPSVRTGAVEVRPLADMG